MLAAALLCALTGCSETRLAYDHLDLIAALKLREYVKFTPPQKQVFEDRFTALWRWHRMTQLPLYAQQLRVLAADVQAPVSVELLRQRSVEINRTIGQTVHRALAETAPVLAQLDDAQIAGLIDAIDRDDARARRKWEQLPDTQWRQKLSDQLVEQFKRWSGSVSDEQRGLIAAWSASQVRDRDASRLDDVWRAAFAQLLQQRRAPDFAQRLDTFLFEPEQPELKEVLARAHDDDERRLQLFAQLAASASEPQKAHYRQRLLDLAKDFDTLAAEPGPLPG
jgi:hypothetical protein